MFVSDVDKEQPTLQILPHVSVKLDTTSLEQSAFNVQLEHTLTSMARVCAPHARLVHIRQVIFKPLAQPVLRARMPRVLVKVFACHVLLGRSVMRSGPREKAIVIPALLEMLHPPLV